MFERFHYRRQNNNQTVDWSNLFREPYLFAVVLNVVSIWNIDLLSNNNIERVCVYWWCLQCQFVRTIIVKY